MGYIDPTTQAWVYEEGDNPTTDPEYGSFSGLLNRGHRQVPAMVTTALGNDPVLREAATTAVDRETEGRDMVEQYYGDGLSEDIVAGFMGENGRATDLVVNASGQVPEASFNRWVPRLIARGLVRGATTVTDAAAGGFVGENGRATDLTLNTAGQLIPESLARIAERLSPLIVTPPPADLIDLALDGSRRLRTPDGRALVSRADRLAAWGDSLTEGHPKPSPFAQDGSNSWPGVLDAAWAGSVFNGGVSGQSADEIAIRQGGYALTVAGVTIPATGPVTVVAEQVFAWRIARPWSCVGTLAGVAGTLSRSGETLTFTRAAPGADVVVAAGTAFVSEQGEAHKEDVHVVFAGRNDIAYASPAGNIVDRVVAATVAMMERPGVAHRRTLLVGTTTATSETRGTSNYNAVTAINTALAAIYPDSFYDIRGYLATQAIHDAGITPTAQDIAALNGDTLPPSLMYDPVHYTPATAALVATRIRARLNQKEWII